MSLLKSTLLWVFVLSAIYFGGQWTQGDSSAAQGFGFVTIVVAAVCVYIIFKLMSGSIGGFFKFVLFAMICLFAAYSMGLFDENVRNSFLNGKSATAGKKAVEVSNNNNEAEQLADAMFGDGENNRPLPSTATTDKTAETQESAVDKLIKQGGIVGKIKSLLFGQQAETEQNSNQPVIGNINPLDYPSIEGMPRVISGSVLLVNGLYVKLLGIEAPDPQQTCENRYGGGYYCGQEAITWVQNWLNNRPVTCHILGEVINQWATGICFVDGYQYDVAAVTTNAGWAVAYTKNTDVYIPYEQQAAEKKRGLWQGSFYKPWDWRRIQNRKVEVKINYNPQKPNRKSDSDSMFDFDFDFKKFNFFGLF